MIDYLEICDQAHLMNFEGSSNKKPTKKEIIKAVSERGFTAKNIDIGYDHIQGFYRFGGDLSTIRQQRLSDSEDKSSTSKSSKGDF